MTIHSEMIEPRAIHPASFVDTTDPGAVGARKLWIDTSRGLNAYVLYLRSDDNTTWIPIVSTSHVDTLGFDKTGATDMSAKLVTWLNSKAGEFGGVNYMPTGKYKISTKLLITSDALTGLEWVGDGLGTQYVNGVTGTIDNLPAMIGIQGASGNSLRRIALKNFRVSGTGASDLTRLMSTDNADEVEIDNLYFENNGAEGLVSFGGGNSLRHVMVTKFRAQNVGIALGRSAFNLNSDTTIVNGFMVNGCGAAVETQGSYFQMSNFLIENCTSYGILAGSTWSGDVLAGVQTNARGVVITQGVFRNQSGRCLLLPDYTGHANNGYPGNGGPAHLDGNLGEVKWSHILFDCIDTAAYGGADLWTTVEFSNNLISGQRDAGAGPQNNAISPNGGYWYIHDVVFELGKGIKFSSLIGAQVTPPDGKRQRIERNTVRGQPWFGGSTAAFNIYSDSVIAETTFEDDGSLAAAPTQALYKILDFATGATVAYITAQDFDYLDKNHRFDIGHDHSVIPLLTSTIPPFMTFKPGDTLRATGNQAWLFKKCLTGGTNNPTPLAGITGTGTSGQNTLTVNSTTGLFKYCWITCSGVAAKQVTAINGLVLTLGANLEASPSAAAISYAAPTFATL
jgi:hypothetical protein